MDVLLAYVAICFGPALGLLALERFFGWFVGGGHAPWAREPEPPAGPSLAQMVSDLRRLEDAYREAERSDEQAKGHRMRAIGLAYDDTLRACCASLGLDAPETSPVSALERMMMEAELAQHGVSW
ncbi:hypothetical protein [Solicola sp. PLA-1-18]|uniref:hypothetical protein n=1 Tax=Solicola sp. PLA-1-18 TaxID=3380532 RepID=UPI003B81CADB